MPSSSENPWFPHEIKHLRKLAGTVLSARGIAEALGTGRTRNAVIGKARRLKIELRGAGEGGNSCERAQIKKPKEASGFAAKFLRQKKNGDAPEPPPAPLPTFAPAGEPKHVDIYSLKFRSCRYPYGGAAPYTFCGCQTVEGKSYCRAHYAATSAGLPKKSAVVQV